jgi:hypothetical protein
VARIFIHAPYNGGLDFLALFHAYQRSQLVATTEMGDSGKYRFAGAIAQDIIGRPQA